LCTIKSAVSLVNNGITGKIPSSLSFLKKLLWLDLSYNGFASDTTSGDLDFLAELPSLKVLTLDYNPDITGTLPDFVSDMSTLVELSVSNTGFYGTLPPTLSRLANLEALFLDDCGFVGGLGVVMEMTNLTRVFLENNAFTGTIDDDFFANSTNLVALDVSNCSLGGGHVPGHFFNFSNLEILDMSENGIGGVLPADAMNASDGYLRYLSLHTNNITGSIPSSVGKLGSLVTLDLSQNRFTGSIPPEIGDVSGLDVLFLGNNNFTGATAPEWIRNLTSLSELSLKGSSLTGPIPAFLGDMSRLRLLDLGENDLTGAIPLELDNLGELVVLILNSNELTGELGLGRLSKLGESFLFPTRSFRRSIPPPALTTYIPISAMPPRPFFSSVSFVAEVLLIDGNDLTGDTNAICVHEIEYFISDCTRDPVSNSSEIDCGCCTLCCSDDDAACNDADWLANHEGIWETYYNRVFWHFGNVSISPYLDYDSP
jgi:hypothetical protein